MNMTKSILVCITLAAIAGCGYVQESGAASSKPSSSDKIALLGTPYKTMPKKAELLSESGPLALFSGETAEDTAFNESMLKNDPETPIFRNSLFLRRRMADGSHQWRLVMTTGSDWREASGMNSWSSERAKDVKMYFYVLKAKFSSDGRHLWMVCDPHTYTYLVICSYDIQDRTLRVLTDGDTIDEQPDGTILVKNKKTYLLDENGKSLGARWHDVWISPDGKIVREDESH